MQTITIVVLGSIIGFLIPVIIMQGEEIKERDSEIQRMQDKGLCIAWEKASYKNCFKRAMELIKKKH